MTPDTTLLRFIQISDTHLNPDPAYVDDTGRHPVSNARALVKHLQALPFVPDFIIHTGDVGYDPVEDTAQYETAREIFSGLPCPIYYLAGNHDHNANLQRVLLGRAAPQLPFDQDFEINGVQIVCVDSNQPITDAAGTVSAESLRWLAALCSRQDDERPLLVFTHHNPLPIGGHFWDVFMRMTNGEAFHQALLPARHRLRGVFFGHVHMATNLYRDSILYTSVPSVWYQILVYPGFDEMLIDHDAQPGFNLITVTKGQTFIRRHTFEVE